MTRGFLIKIQNLFTLLAFLGLLASIWFWADVNRASQMSERQFARIEEARLEVLAGLVGQLFSVNQSEEMQPILANLVKTAGIESVWLIDQANRIVAGVPANWIGKAPPDFTQNPGAANRWRSRVLEVKGRPLGKLAILVPNPQTAWARRPFGQETILPAGGMIVMALLLGFMAALFLNRRQGRVRAAPLPVPNRTDKAWTHRPEADASLPGDSDSGAEIGGGARKVERGADVEAALRERREREIRALTGGSDGFWDWNIDTGKNYFSRQWLENLGYADGDLEHNQDTFNSLIHRADLDAVFRAKAAHLEKGEPYNVEFRIRKKDGNYLWVRSKGHVELDEAGQPVGMAGTLSDISRRKAAEEALRESEARYRDLYNHTPVMMHAFDDEGVVVSVNDFWLSEMGYRGEEVIGKQFVDFMPERDGQLTINEGLQTFRRDGFIKNLPRQFIKKNGEVMDILISAVRVENEQDKSHQNLAFITDITTRVRAERELRENQRLLQSVFDTIPQWIFVKDLGNRYLLVNRALAETFNKRPEEFINTTAADFSIGTEAQREMFRKVDLTVMETVSAVERNDVEVAFPDGTPHFQNIVKMPLLDDRGEITGVLGVIEDITDRKHTEAKLRMQAQIIERTHECIIATDETGLITSWNGGAERVFGYTAKETIGKMRGADMYPARQQSFYQEQVVDPAVEKGNNNLEVILRKKSGGEFHGLLSLTILKNERGEVTGRIGHVLDITERKQIEAQLRLQAQIIEQTHECIITTDKDRLITSWNGGAERLFGYTAEETIGRMKGGELYPAHLETFYQEQVMAPAVEKGKITLEMILQKKSGEIFHGLLSLTTLKNERGEITGRIGHTLDITERKLAEEALRANERLLQTVFDTVPHWIMVKDRESKILMVNKAMGDSFGLDSRDFIGRLAGEIEAVPQETRRLGRETDRKVINTGEGIDLREYIVTLPGGAKRRGNLVKRPLVDEAGNITGVLGISQDMTAQMEAEETLRKTQRLLQSVFDTIPQWIFVKDPEDRYLLVNRALADTYDRHPDEFINATAAEFSIGTEAQREMFRKVDLGVMETRSAVEIKDLEVTFPDGTPHFQHIVKMPLLDDGGEITGILGVVEDITELKNIESKLRLQAQIIDQTHECIITADGTGHITSWNGGAERLFGYTAKEMIGKMKATDLYPVGQQLFVQKQVLAPALEKGNLTLEVIMKKKSGEEFNGLLSLTILKNERGEVTGRIGHTLDITERKMAEEALKGSEQRFRNLIEGSLQGTYIMKEYKLLFANLAMADMFGFESVEKLLAIDNFLDLFAPQFRKQASQRYEDRRGGKNILENFEFEGIRRDGSRLWVEGLAKGVVWEGKEVVQCTLFDVTKRKQAEEELKIHRDHLEDLVRERTRALESAQKDLVRNERMATLGQLTATVSHELRNPLGTIRTSVFSITKKIFPDTLGIGKALARIDRNVTRCDDIIGDLLDFTRNRAPKRSTTNVDEWIAGLLNEQNVPDWLELKLNLTAENQPVELDRDYIRRAVINLFDNARQALEGWQDASDKKKPRITIGARIEGQWLKISVKDSGPGMSQEVLEKVFEPLFSTKTYGVGLGLPTVYQIMQLNGGSISINSRVGKGTQAVLKLPLNTPPEKQNGAPVA